MTTTMPRVMRMELANAIRGRYLNAAGKEKRRILEEFIAATGYHEKVRHPCSQSSAGAEDPAGPSTPAAL